MPAGRLGPRHAARQLPVANLELTQTADLVGNKCENKCGGWAYVMPRASSQWLTSSWPRRLTW